MSTLSFTVSRAATGAGWTLATPAPHDTLWTQFANRFDFVTASNPAQTSLNVAAGALGTFTDAQGDVAFRGIRFDGSGGTLSNPVSVATLDWQAAGATALLSHDRPWGAIKNVEVGAFSGTTLTVRNFVDAWVHLADNTGRTIIIEGAKRGEVSLGDGADRIELGIDSESAQQGNDFRLASGGGADTIIIRGATVNAVAGTYLGQWSNVEVNAGAGDDTIIGWGSRDIVDGGEGTDTFVLRGLQSGYSITTLAGVTTIIDTRLSDGDDRTDTLVGVERIRFGNGAVLVLDQPVTAVDDRYLGVEDTVLAVVAAQGLLANDSAPDGGRAAIAGVFATARGGSVTIAADGSFTYTPPADAFGNDSFTYTVRDADGDTDTGLATVNLASVADIVGSIQLSTLEAQSAGYRIIGAAANNYAGVSIAAIGDINADGFDDLVVGASGFGPADPNDTEFGFAQTSDGTAYVVYGKATTTTLDLATVSTTGAGYRLVADPIQRFLGEAAAAIGDQNGDGLTDYVLGAPRVNSALYPPVGYNVPALGGQAFVVYGRAEGGPINLATLQASGAGYRITSDGVYPVTGTSVPPEREDWAGQAVASAGDVNNDGITDIILGAPGSPAVAAYVVFGGGTGDLSLATAPAAGRGFRILEGAIGTIDYATIGESGWSVAGIGDVNGDGRDDVAVGAPFAYGGNGAGQVFVVFGQTTGTDVRLDTLAADGKGFVISGGGIGDYRMGISLAAIGDINNDGIGDLLIGDDRRSISSPADGIGVAHVVFGKAGTAPVNVSTLAADGKGFTIRGDTGSVGQGALTGRSVAAVGDIDGDGITELLIGAVGVDTAGGENTGAAYLVFGHTGGDIDLAGAIATGGAIRFDGNEPSDFAGGVVAAAGDINNDGVPDLVISATVSDPNVRLNAGTAYVVFGKAAWGADSPILARDDAFFTQRGVPLVVTASGGLLANDQLTLGAAAIASTFATDAGGSVTIGAAGGFTYVPASGFNGIDHIDYEVADAAGNRSVATASVTVRRPAFDAISLATAAANGDGFRIDGTQAGTAGSITGIGDQNGDGLDDLLIGGGYFGVHVVFGKADTTTVGLNTVTVDGKGFRLAGFSEEPRYLTVEALGDVNGDGVQDYGINEHEYYFTIVRSGFGDVATIHVVFGGATGGDIDLEAFGATGLGFNLTDVASINGSQGHGTFSGAGDQDGDGLDDILVDTMDYEFTYGGEGGGLPGVAYSGHARIAAGQTASSEVDIGLDTTGPLPSGIVAEVTGGAAPARMEGLGDVNGDGHADFAIAEGRIVHVAFGGIVGRHDLMALDGFLIAGPQALDGAAYVFNAGDVNGDGMSDLLVGFERFDPSYADAARTAYIVFGKTDGGTVDVSTLAQTGQGFRITDTVPGAAIVDRGQWGAGIGDVNGDGFDDVAIGRDTDGGSVLIVLGKADAATVDLAVAAARGEAITILRPNLSEPASLEVAAAGDVNGDDIPDILIGATAYNDAYVVFGQLAWQDPPLLP